MLPCKAPQSTKTLLDAKEEMRRFRKSLFSYDTRNDAGAWYDYKSDMADGIADILESANWTSEARRFLLEALESARYVGD
jgi:hypothetical protein